MQIREMASELKLPYIKDNYQYLIDKATHTKMDYAEFIKNFLEDFDRNKYGPEFKNKFEELETLKFIDNKENVILIGTPGAGKSHYSIGLGIKACMCG
jgi:DNA replication protein DnaC